MISTSRRPGSRSRAATAASTLVSSATSRSTSRLRTSPAALRCLATVRRLARNILAAIDADIGRHRYDPAAAIRAIFAAIGQDLARPEFRGCAFNNTSIEFSDPDHPARRAARDYRAELLRRLTDLARAARPDAGPELGAQLAVLVDGMYTSAAHLGPNGPAATGPALAEVLLRGHR